MKCLCRIAVEESIRGVLVQQGVVALGCRLACEGETHEIKALAAHVVAKICVMLNPNLLPPHLR